MAIQILKCWIVSPSFRWGRNDKNNFLNQYMFTISLLGLSAKTSYTKQLYSFQRIAHVLKQMTKQFLLSTVLVTCLGLFVNASAQQLSEHHTKQTKSKAPAKTASPVTKTVTPTPIAAMSPAANTQPVAEQNQHIWNLQDADIRAVIDAVSKATGKNFIIDPHVQGKITIVSNKPMGPDEAYQVFLSSLQVLGYAAVPSGNVIKIVPNTAARSLSAPISNAQNPGQGDEFIVRTIHVKNVAASQLVPILQPLVPEWSFVSAYIPTNTLILSGQANNINRLVSIVDNIDQKATNETQVINLQHASANKVLSALTALQNANRAAGKISSASFAADPQANSIIINGTPDDMIQLTNIIRQLDKPGSGDIGLTQVIYLNYLDAKKFAPILAKIAHSAYSSDDESAGKMTSTTSAPGSIQATASLASNPDDSDAINKQIAIQAEPTSNALIISAPAPMMANLKAIIAQLDVQPQQVLVEAIIAQVDERLIRQLGIRWGVQPDADASDTPSSTSDSSDIPLPGSIGFIRSGNLRIIVDALSSDNAADILSTPSIAVLDNQQAEIQVGKIIPIENRQYATSTTGNNSDNSTPFTTFEQKPVVLKLTVTPQISPNQFIRLNIKQVNDSLQNPDNPGPLPIINTSNIKTNIMVKSGDIVVLGGLISNQYNDATQRVPVLGDIPLVGNLFKHKDKEMEKLNLLVFLRPIILAQNAQTQQITQERYDAIRQQQLLRREGKDILTTDATPLLPALKKTDVQLPPPF